MNELPHTGYVRERQLLGDKKATPPVPAILPVAHSTLWQWVKDGRFPKPVKLGPRTTAWDVSTLRDYFAKVGGTRP